MRTATSRVRATPRAKKHVADIGAGDEKHQGDNRHKDLSGNENA